MNFSGRKIFILIADNQASSPPPDANEENSEDDNNTSDDPEAPSAQSGDMSLLQLALRSQDGAGPSQVLASSVRLGSASYKIIATTEPGGALPQPLAGCSQIDTIPVQVVSASAQSAVLLPQSSGVSIRPLDESSQNSSEPASPQPAQPKPSQSRAPSILSATRFGAVTPLCRELSPQAAGSSRSEAPPPRPHRCGKTSPTTITIESSDDSQGPSRQERAPSARSEATPPLSSRSSSGSDAGRSTPPPPQAGPSNNTTTSRCGEEPRARSRQSASSSSSGSSSNKSRQRSLTPRTPTSPFVERSETPEVRHQPYLVLRMPEEKDEGQYLFAEEEIIAEVPGPSTSGQSKYYKRNAYTRRQWKSYLAHTKKRWQRIDARNKVIHDVIMKRLKYLAKCEDKFIKRHRRHARRR